MAESVAALIGVAALTGDAALTGVAASDARENAELFDRLSNQGVELSGSSKFLE